MKMLQKNISELGGKIKAQGVATLQSRPFDEIFYKQANLCDINRFLTLRQEKAKLFFYYFVETISIIFIQKHLRGGGWTI